MRIRINQKAAQGEKVEKLTVIARNGADSHTETISMPIN